MTKLFAPKPPTPPKPEPIPEMADTEAINREKKKKIAEISSRSGRASTILSQNDGFGL